MASDALRLAVGTLTRAAGRRGRRRSAPPDVAARAMLLAPLAVLPLALVAGLVSAGRPLAGWPALVVGLLVVAGLALGTRALHLDGLADTVDGLGTGWDARAGAGDHAARRRRTDGRGRPGARARAAGGRVRRAAADARRGAGRRAAGLRLPGVAAAGLPARRAGRPAGRARPAVAGTVAPVAGIGVGLVAAAVVLLAAHLVGRPWLQGLVAAALALVVVAVLVGHVVRRLGGVSGDVMGAAVEVALTALLVGVAAR